MTSLAKGPDHDDVRMLIPWLLNGTLSEAEASRVRAHVASCTICRADATLHESMRLAVIQDEATPIVPTASAHSLLDDFVHRDMQAKVRYSSGRLAAAAAFALAALITVVAITTELGPGTQNPTYQTATTAQKDSEIGYVLRLRFEDGVSAEHRDRVIEELGATEIRDLDNSEAYEVLVHLPSSSIEELERFADETQARSEIMAAEFVALRLPVR